MALNGLKQRPMRAALIVFALCCVSLALAVAYRAQHALTQAAHDTAAAHQLRFTIVPLETSHRASAFEAVPAAATYTSGAELAGQLYLAGPDGLTVLDADGQQRVSLRTGQELPVAQIVAITTGRLHGATEPQVLLATAGAGVLVFSPSRTGAINLQQILPSLPDDADLTALQVLPSGDLLLGTRHTGVLRFTGATLEPLATPNADHLQVTALAAADSASVLVGTRSRGVFYLHAGTVDHAGKAEGLPDDQVESLLVHGSHAYVGTPLGVTQFDLQPGEFHPARTLAPGMFAHALALSADGHELSIGTLDQGVQRIPLGGTAKLRQVSIDLNQAQQHSGRVDQFIAAQGRSAALIDGKLQGSSSPLSQSQTLTDRNVSALAFDAHGALFVGYFDRGLDVLSNGAVRHFENDSLFCLNRLALDPRRGTIAAATANGLVLFDQQGVPRQTLTRRDGLLSDHVTDVAFTRTGTVLATPAGLTFVNAAGMESLYAFQGLVNNHVYALAADPATDHVLAGTLGGLSMLDAEQIKRNLTVANSGLKHNWITALAPIGPGDWLVGTYGAGVLRVTADGTFSTIDLPPGAPRDLVINPNALLVTATHAYAGTLGHGMLVYSKSNGRWSVVTTGLPSLNITAFAEHEGELYIGTDNGLVRIAEALL